MKNISTKALIGSILIVILVLAAFLWVMFKPQTPPKYHPPYKYYSGDKPGYGSGK
ncbi:MAG: hypothetical protein WC913_09270 [Desulfuromonas sp.]